jgi:hypothetical protein
MRIYDGTIIKDKKLLALAIGLVDFEYLEGKYTEEAHLMFAFSWIDTPQGYDFWNGVDLGGRRIIKKHTNEDSPKNKLFYEREEDLEAKYEAEKERADGLEAQLKKIQPFDQYAEGWYSEGKAWALNKAFYITKYNHEHILIVNGRIFWSNDFTTENPHKKETVFLDGHQNNGNETKFKEYLENCDIAILTYYGANKIQKQIHFHVGDKTYTLRFKQIGTDHQAKFDDPNCKDWIDLTK